MRLCRWIAPLSLGCVLELPPPSPPPRYAPVLQQQPGPLAEGQGRLVVDALNGPARVSVVEPTGDRFVCLSPCAVDLPPGPHRLHLVAPDDREETVTVDVAADGAVYQGILGVKRDYRTARWVLIGTAVVGAVVMGFGLSDLIKTDDNPTFYMPDNGVSESKDNTHYMRGFWLTTLGGALVAGGGGGALWLRDEVQPSTFIRWVPPAAAPPPTPPAPPPAPAPAPPPAAPPPPPP